MANDLVRPEQAYIFVEDHFGDRFQCLESMIKKAASSHKTAREGLTSFTQEYCKDEQRPDRVELAALRDHGKKEL